MIGRREFVAGAAMLATTRVRAETGEVKIARQPSLGHLPLMIMEDRQMLQKEAAARGIADLKASYITLAGGAAMNDALLSGAIQFAAGAVPPLVLLWSKTQNTRFAVKGVAAMNSMPLFLNTVNPKVRSLRDFTDSDKIALPAVKVSVQAMFLQMAAEKQLGADHLGDLDRLTVTLSHPDGMAAMFAGQVTAHFTAAPIQELELRRPGVHTVLDTYDVLGAPSTFNVVWASSSFVDRNPHLYEAFTSALGKAIVSINADKKSAAATYVRLSKDPSDVALITELLDNPRNRFTTTPQNIGAFLDFMSRTHVVQRKADSWKDLFFSNVHDEPGN